MLTYAQYKHIGTREIEVVEQKKSINNTRETERGNQNREEKKLTKTDRKEKADQIDKNSITTKQKHYTEQYSLKKLQLPSVCLQLQRWKKQTKNGISVHRAIVFPITIMLIVCCLNTSTIVRTLSFCLSNISFRVSYDKTFYFRLYRIAQHNLNGLLCYTIALSRITKLNDIEDKESSQN